LALGATLALSRRSDLTDPAEIAELPPGELRDAEIERLVRAAFANARSAHIKSEAAPSITVTDPKVLEGLSSQFAVGSDSQELPMYRHPGLEYTVVTFNGPYTPRIGFTGPKDAMLMSDKPGRWRHFGVRTKFALALANVLGLSRSD
jgi:hypothetical protein